MFLFLLFLHFHSCSSFFPVPLFHLLYSLFYLFSPFLWETTQNDPQGLSVVKPQHNQSYELSHQDLHCLPFCSWFLSNTPFATIEVSKFNDGRVHLRNSGVKGLKKTFECLIYVVLSLTIIIIPCHMIAAGYYGIPSIISLYLSVSLCFWIIR